MFLLSNPIGKVLSLYTTMEDKVFRKYKLTLLNRKLY